MTKRKTGAFAGAWLDDRIPVAQLRARLEAESVYTVDVDAVLLTLRRAMEIWRFDLARRSAEPQPAEWRGLVEAIAVPESPDPLQMLRIQEQITRLPAQVIAALDIAIYREHEIGFRQLLDRIVHEADSAHVGILRSALERVAAECGRIRGKRGPRQDPAPAVRAVTVALQQNSTMRAVAARQLAAELLIIAGIPAPQGRSQLAKIMKA